MVIHTIGVEQRPNSLTQTARRAPETTTGFSTHLQQAQQKAPVAYTVKRGDTLSHIVASELRAAGKTATRKDIYGAVSEVARANNLSDPDAISPHQKLDLSPLAAFTQSKSSDALQTVQPRVAASAIPAAQSKPQHPILADRESARLLRSAAAVRANADETLRHAAAALELLLQDGPRVGFASARPAGAAKSAALAAPLAAASQPWAPLLSEPAWLSSNFGARKDPFTGRRAHHDGVDLAAGAGADIFPLMPGTVTFSGWKRGYGNVVIVDHGQKIETLYGHNDENLVAAGDQVDQTVSLGKVGSTGRATGDHLHFEVRKDGKAINPISFMKGRLLQVAGSL